nr:PREDICTED: uncharacterized protein LOC109034738 [Bemisia tabaci]
MEQRVLLIFAVICFQESIAAPLPYVTRLNAPPRIQNPTENEVSSGPNPNNAEFYQELQRLKDSAAGFQNQIVNFTAVLSSQLQPGSALWNLTDDVIKSATNRVISYIESVEASGAEFLANATRAVGGQMQQGKKILDDKLMYAQKTVEGLKKKNEEMFRDGMSYLENLESNLKANLMRDTRLAIESGNDSSDPKVNFS